MLTKNEKTNLIKKVEDLKTEISSIKDSLNEINSQKEAWFEKKEKFQKEISNQLLQVKENKKERDNLTSQVKKFKDGRTKLNSTIKDEVITLKKLNTEKTDIAIKLNIKGDPGKLMKDIEALELIIETEVISFEKEKGLMKTIKDKKKQLLAASEITGILSKARNQAKIVRDIRKEAENMHRNIKKFASESQVKHESIIKILSEVDKLRKNEEEAYKKFFEFKKEFVAKNAILKEKLLELRDVNEKLKHNNMAARAEKDEKDRKTITKLKQEVDQKIKKGRILTTDDLLVYQRADMSNKKKN